MSLDGYGAGADQSPEQPLGRGGEELHGWMVGTRTFRERFEEEGGETGADDDLTAEGFEGIGATIMGRNMFGPVRGPWPDDSWRGWWGPNPPYHHPVFVLTHHARDPIPMEGGTTFNFVTDGIERALEQAFDAADGLDVRLGGGVATVQSYLRAGLVDEAHFAISPIMLGAGERLFDNLGDATDRYECTRMLSTAKATHVVLTRRA
jgi:dihydrofolate reductase